MTLRNSWPSCALTSKAKTDPMTSAANDRRWMKLALVLGARGLGRVAPNPAVGCVLIKENRVVGRGWTQPGGRPHAEAMALEAAGMRARGATAYVTLEPCAHHGKTAPCAEALISAGVSRVVVALRDPDPRVNGKGMTALAAAGIEVTEGVRMDEAAQAHVGFFSRVGEGRPYLTLKLATSIDGRIATGSGDSQWITGPEARRAVHLLRSQHDAVLIGAGTARDDLPSLTVRDLGVDHAPVRIVVSSRLALPQAGPLAETAQQVPVWLIHAPGVAQDRLTFWRDAGAHCLEVPSVSGGQVNVTEALATCAREGLTRVLCEGGGQLAATLLHEDVVDRMVQHVGGVAIGAEGRPSLGALGLPKLIDASRFEVRHVRQIGPDVQLVWDRRRSK